MQTYAYMRVSTREQNEDRQRAALEPYHLAADHIFLDKQSGKDFQRPQYRLMLRRLKRGDLLLIKSIDRLGRNYQEILEQWRNLTKRRGVDIRVLDMPLLDTTREKDLLGTLIADLVLQLLSFVAQNERESIKLRQAEGIAAAKRRGVRFGRPEKFTPETFQNVYAEYRSGRMTSAEAAARLSVSRSTFYRHIQQLEENAHLNTNKDSEKRKRK